MLFERHEQQLTHAQITQWLWRAIPRPVNNPALATPHDAPDLPGQIVWAADGYRMHAVWGVTTAGLGIDAKPVGKPRAGALLKHVNNTVVRSLYTAELRYLAQDAVFGETNVGLDVMTPGGQVTTCFFNPRYITDAITIMPAQIEFRYNVAQQIAYFGYVGKALAVIMPLTD